MTQTPIAPAERASGADLERQKKQIAEAAFFRDLLNAVPEILMVLNGHRQLVFANAAFCKATGAGSMDELLGGRQGELLGCMHAQDGPGGCGTGPSCRKCGALLAILGAQRGQATQSECRIALAENGGSLELKVAATPLNVGGRDYTVFAATDISGEKRRQVLEQLMFRHLSHGLEAVHTSIEAPHSDDTREEVRSATGRLLGTISTYRLLAAAESGRLKPKVAAISALQLLQEVAEHVVADDAREQVILAASGDLVFNADRTLLKCVMNALVTNALEASLPGETITLKASEDAEGITLSVHNRQAMAEDAQLQIFQRGFSTKGEGRGIGLYSARLFVERYLRGRLSFRSDLAEGTEFRVSLPQGGGQHAS